MDKKEIFNQNHSQTIKTRLTVTIKNPLNIMLCNETLLDLLKGQGILRKMKDTEEKLKNWPNSKKVAKEFNLIDKHIVNLQKKSEKNQKLPCHYLGHREYPS